MDEIDAGADIISAEDLTDITEPVAGENGEIDWAVEGPKFKGIAQRRTTALKKAKDALGKTTPITPKPNETPTPKAGEIGFGEKAYINSLGFKEADQHAFISKAMKETGQDLETTLASSFVQGELKRIGEEIATKNAAPSSEAGRQGAPARNEVAYWIAKGETPPNTPENQKLRQDIVKHKRQAAGAGSQFTNTPVA